MTTGDDVVVERIVADGMLQLIGTTSESGLVDVAFDHDVGCDGVSAEITVHEDGSASVQLRNELGSVVGSLGVATPWALDADGEAVPTWFKADGTRLRQIVDTSAAALPVTFDPTYTTISCAGRWNDLVAYWYLNLDPGDIAYCASSGMFIAANGYTPVWGFETNVANDFGKIALRQDGGCSNSPDTGWAWDFQVPCKAHDYCYDLRKASFSGTVSDNDCDLWFFWMMEAHCNDRFFSGDCRIIRDLYYAAVSLPGVVTEPNPGLVEIQNFGSSKCADIEGPSTADNTPIQQWSCVGVSNQRFRIWPAPGAPGYFQIKPQHASGLCARALTDPVQWACSNTWNTQRFKLQGALNLDRYSIRSKYRENECWKVPTSYANGADLEDPACFDTNNWYLWSINDA
ncbi:MAG: hypothetical protein D6683_07890 [Actinomyces sp.]|nr:MAG: hypothetical protein D6683_07890 [Actinomyces sp.]